MLADATNLFKPHTHNDGITVFIHKDENSLYIHTGVNIYPQVNTQEKLIVYLCIQFTKSRINYDVCIFGHQLVGL